MKAIGFYRYLPIENEKALQDVEVDKPSVAGYDLLVKVNAVSVNPVDTKVRAPKEKLETSPRVLGWDAAGIVEAIGEKVTDFSVGDQVFYAGDITRSGSNAEYQAVDSRIVGRKPNNLTFSEAAALPLTSITAWEALFERLAICSQSTGNLLIIGGAGGVGSIAIQLAKKLTNLSIIATASRPETITWCQALGADKVVNHREDLVEQLNENSINYILCLNDTQGHWQAMTQSPELNPIEQVWQWLRQRHLSNRKFKGYEDIMDACTDAWNSFRKDIEAVKSICTRDWIKLT